MPHDYLERNEHQREEHWAPSWKLVRFVFILLLSGFFACLPSTTIGKRVLILVVAAFILHLITPNRRPRRPFTR